MMRTLKRARSSGQVVLTSKRDMTGGFASNGGLMSRVAQGKAPAMQHGSPDPPYWVYGSEPGHDDMK